LHPFMPFLTEELWHELKERDQSDSICVAHWPNAGVVDTSLMKRFEHTQEVISALRTLRKDKNLKPKEVLEVYTLQSETIELFPEVLSKLGFTEALIQVESAPENAISFRVGTVEYYVPLGNQIDVEEEREKLQKELEYQKGFLAKVNQKLKNERFVSNAPEAVVAIERKKADDAQEKIQAIESALEKLG